MPEPKRAKRHCFLAIPFASRFDEIRKAVEDGVLQAGFDILAFNEPLQIGQTVRDMLMAKMAKADCVVAEVSDRNPNVHFELGIAQAMGKFLLPIVNEESISDISFDIRELKVLSYEQDTKGLSKLSRNVSRQLLAFRKYPRRMQAERVGRLSTPYFIDWDRLEPSDADNLLRELLTQMGFRQIEWNKHSKEYDLVAEYPRKDPDGFEFRELWIVASGRHAPFEFIAEMSFKDPEYLLHRLMQNYSRSMRSKWDREDFSNVTLLLVAFDQRRYADEFEFLRERIASLKGSNRPRIPLRIRLWDRDYLTTLVQQFPNIGYKYFSDEARSLSKFRKGPEELYEENLRLNANLTNTVANLEQEKVLRVRAERDAIWKDISFSAAHKLGNPIFAIETDLDPLQKRIKEDREVEAIEVVSNIRRSVDKAKCIVEQFKSLTKAQDISPISTLLDPILIDACHIAKNQGVDCKISCPNDLRVYGDPDRLAEVFDELTVNSLHWLDKSERQITISAELANKANLPSGLLSDRTYVIVHFKDNGPGIETTKKLKIFDAFFTTHDQGTGLGLALVRRIVDGHNGMIAEIGIPRDGADFEIYLPASDEPQQ